MRFFYCQAESTVCFYSGIPKERGQDANRWVLGNIKARELGYKTMNEQDCKNWANQMKSRLINMVDNRPYVFRDTKREIAEAYLARKKQFIGVSEIDLQALENKLATPLPVIFKAYLTVMGRQHGILFTGSDSDPDEFLDYRIWAEEIFQKEQRPSCLTPNSVVFCFTKDLRFNISM